MTRQKRNTKEIVLVEFKASKQLVEDFDSKWREHGFSSRSEALRHLMRTFLGGK